MLNVRILFRLCVIIALSLIMQYQDVCIPSTVEPYRESWCIGPLDGDTSDAHLVIRVSACIVRRDDGTDGRSLQDVEQSIGDLNNAFNDGNITFYLSNVFFVNNTEWCDYQISPGTFELSEYYLDDHYNIVYRPEACLHGSQFSGLGGNVMIMGNPQYLVDLFGDYLSYDSVLIIHEAGHTLGLLHPFYAQEGFYLPEYPWEDDPDSACLVKGDYVCDTPPSPGIEYGYEHFGHILGSGPPDCEYLYPEPTEPCNEPDNYGEIDWDNCLWRFNPLTTNYMEYGVPGCRDHFTAGQLGRVRTCLIEEFISRGIAVYGSTVRYQAAQPAGFQYEDETPYSCLLLDYNNDTLQDMFISIPDDNSELYRCTGVDEQTGLPIFMLRNNLDFAPGDAPSSGLHGLASCDFDGNGHDDIFASADAANTAKLYQFLPELGQGGQFRDVADEVGIMPFADNSWCAAWVEYDADMDLDLLIGRASHIGTEYGPTDFDFINDPVYLLRNDYEKSGLFVDCTEEAGLGGIWGAFLSVTSEDFDHDNDMDIVLSNIIDYSGGGVGSLVMYLNNDKDGTYTHASLPGRIPDQELIQAVSGASFVDLDGDRDMDLVLSSQAEYGYEPWVLFNSGNGFFYMQPHLRLRGTGKTQGLCLYDHDNSGDVDILLLPASNTDHPWLFTNLDTHVFVDETATVGLTDTGRVHGAIAYNWGSQGYPDLYFGRPINASDPRHYYQASNSGGPSGMTNNWIGFRLVATGANNASSIGAHVTVTYDNRTPMQTIDGGSGRGSQRSRELLFGLGEWSNSVDVTVEWPNGHIQHETYSFAELNQVHAIADMTDPGLDDSTVNCTTRLMPGGFIQWTFTWDTEYRTHATRDTLLISGPGFSDPSVFTADAGSITKNPDGTYAHRIAFTRLCKTGVFPYTVSSSTDSIQSSSEAGRSKRVTICSSF